MSRRNKNGANEKDNFQDRAETAEYAKGKAAGEMDVSEDKKRNSRSGSNNKGKESDSKSADKSQKQRPAVAIYTGAGNPIDMHSFNDAYLEPLGKITTNLRNGYPEQLSLGNDHGLVIYSTKPLNGQQPVGGVMAMPFIPTIGETVDAQDGINLANITLFNKVRAATGGTSYYEAPDLGIYNIAMSNVYAYYAALIRIYGTVKSYEYDNMYVPEGIMYAHGINWTDVQQHIEDFRGWINLFAHKIEQLRMPSGLNYLRRMTWMNSNVYLDSQVTNSQLYEFVQMAFYQLQEGITAHAYQYYYKKQVKAVNYELWHLKLIAAPWASDGVHINGVGTSQAAATVADLIAFGEDLLRPLTNSQDCKYISAGYERAFQDFMAVNPISEEFKIYPVYDSNVLAQIENATFYHGLVNYGCVIQEDISINSGNLQSDLRLLQDDPAFGSNYQPPAALKGWIDLAKQNILQFGQYLSDAEPIINKHDAVDLSPADVMEYTRMITYYNNQVPITLNTDDQFYSNCVNSEQITAETNKQMQWFELQTYASNVMLPPVLCVFTFINAQQPWKGINKLAIQMQGTEDIQLDQATLAATIPGASSAGASATVALIQFISNKLYLADYAETLLSQWDWHPKWVRWNIALSFGGSASAPTVAETIDYHGMTLDMATYARTNFKQLQDLNRYDMLSQFTLPQLGSYAVQ